MSDFLYRFFGAFTPRKNIVVGTIWGRVSECFLGGAALFMVAMASASSADSPLELAPGLHLILPKPLSLQYIQPDSANDSPVLMGHIEGVPGYFMVADKVAEKQRASVLWEKIEMEIRARADRQSFEVGDRGSFTTTGGAKVWYRSYRYLEDDVVYKPVYYLISQGGVSYWVTLTVAEEVNRAVVKPIADAVLKRVIVSDRASRD